MSVLPSERTIEATCGAEDVTAYTIGKEGVRYLNLATVGRGTPLFVDRIEALSFEHCPWTGLVTEFIYTHAGIAEWQCPLCRTTHTKELTT